MPPGSLLKGNLRLVPVLHGRMEFAVEVRRAWAEYRPQAVAVELPRSLTRAVGQAVARLPHLSVVLAERQSRVRYLLIEPTDPLSEALRLAREEDRPSFLVDAEVEDYPDLAEAWPDPYALARLGLDSFSRPFLERPPAPTAQDELREATMAQRLQELTGRFERVLFVCGLGHAGRILARLDSPQALPLSRVKAPACRPANLDPESIKECTTELPRLMRAYEDWRREGGAAPDRLLVQEDILQAAAQDLNRETGQEIQPWQFKILRQFRRNWALLGRRLTPDFFQLVISARGLAGDEFAHHVWQRAVEYPWRDLEPGWETVRLRAEDLGRNRKTVRFFKPLRRTRPRLVPLPSRPQRVEDYPGQWAEAWRAGGGICSFPPEDLVIEGFGRDLARKALKRLAEANRRVEPFTCSLLDGVDFRETLRRICEERLYVFEERPIRGKVGAVVVVFDPDQGEAEKFPWKLTWLGEHQDESDMALYATRPGQDLIGPGISRCLYGGLVMTYPPLRMYDVWQDAYFDLARTKAERLLLAGADYSRERVVAYLAKSPPSPRVRSIVERMGRQVAFVPLGLFAPAYLNKLRVFHVLAGHETRARAADYIQGPGGFRVKRQG